MKPYAYATETSHEGLPAHSRTLMWSDQYTGNPGPIKRGTWGTEVCIPLYAIKSKKEAIELANSLPDDAE